MPTALNRGDAAMPMGTKVSYRWSLCRRSGRAPGPGRRAHLRLFWRRSPEMARVTPTPARVDDNQIDLLLGCYIQNGTRRLPDTDHSGDLEPLRFQICTNAPR